jgi:hypothetical protein
MGAATPRMNDNKRLSERVARRFQAGSPKLDDRFRYFQKNISLIFRRELIDRFKKSVLLMCRQNFSRKRRPDNNRSNSKGLKGPA